MHSLSVVSFTVWSTLMTTRFTFEDKSDPALNRGRHALIRTSSTSDFCIVVFFCTHRSICEGEYWLNNSPDCSGAYFLILRHIHLHSCETRKLATAPTAASITVLATSSVSRCGRMDRIVPPIVPAMVSFSM